MIPFPPVGLEFELDVQLPEIRPDHAADAIRSTARAAAEFARALWIQRAQDLRVRHSGAYLRGIQEARVRVVSEHATEDQVEIVLELVNEAPHAGIVEEGHGAFRLPDKINWNGPNVKRGPNGPYLHIPFRHRAFQNAEQREQSGMTIGSLRQMMPEDIYRQALRLHFTTRQNVGPIFRHGGNLLHGPQWRGAQAGNPQQIQFVAADRYTRGKRSRLSHPTTGPMISVGPDGTAVEVRRGERTGLGGLTNPAWQNSRFHGMFKSGSKGHAEYMTIRTITPRSAGWSIPAQDGHHIARQVERALGSGPGGDRFRALLTEAAARAAVGGGG